MVSNFEIFSTLPWKYRLWKFFVLVRLTFFLYIKYTFSFSHFFLSYFYSPVATLSKFDYFYNLSFCIFCDADYFCETIAFLYPLSIHHFFECFHWQPTKVSNSHFLFDVIVNRSCLKWEWERWRIDENGYEVREKKKMKNILVELLINS